MKTCCVIVIGHVDHGKTTLVKALTGIETDRLPEEKARGLSITPGFAHHTFPSGIVDFVDAPGHADFISAMVSGATGAQAALIVISISEGLGAQTFEHLRIAELLGIKNAVIAVTKADLLTAKERAAHLRPVQAALYRTLFAQAPLVICSARSGEGMQALNAALENLINETPNPSPALHSTLPIDRVFSMPGRGTIVTGTLLGSTLTLENTVTLQPSQRAVTIRALQSRGEDRDRIFAGERMAANLRGVTEGDIPRGSVLCATGIMAPTRCVDVRLGTLHSPARNLKHMQEVRVLFGTCNEVAQVRLFRNEDQKGDFAQLRFRKPVACFAGQRAILRSLSPAATIGGALFVDPHATPTRPNDMGRLAVLTAASDGHIPRLADALTNVGRGVANLSNIARLARLSPEDARKQLQDGFVALQEDVITSTKNIETAKNAVLEALAAYHSRYPLRRAAPRASIDMPALSPRLLHFVEDDLLADNKIRKHSNMLAHRDHDPLAQLSQAQHKIMLEIEDQFRLSGLVPLTPEYLSTKGDAADILQLLVDGGVLIVLHNIALKQMLVFHTDTVAAAIQTLAAGFPSPLPFTTSQARSTLGTSRKVIVPLLEYFDSIGVTLRKDDMRQLAPANLVSPHTADG